jgi:hypothetical protein
MAEDKPKAENNVKCSFCGNETFCERCAADASGIEKFEHMCYDCYTGMGSQVPPEVQEKTHTCIPPEKAAEEFGRFLDSMTGRAFDELWNQEKKKLREMSKQELAQASFFEGARFMFQMMQKLQQPEEEEAGKKESGQAKEGKK